MTEEVRKYAEKCIIESGIRMVPGHYPEFESKEQVNMFVQVGAIMSEKGNKAKVLKLTVVDLAEYQELLDRLKRNKENVSLDILLTKYRKSYDQIRETLQAMTKQILQDVVLSELKIERFQAWKEYIEINTAIQESGILEKVSHAVFQQYNADLVFGYAFQLRNMVHQIAKGSEESGG